jgi:hypothetical protein
MEKWVSGMFSKALGTLAKECHCPRNSEGNVM